ncbi:alpha-1,2-mannosyltransferase ALG9 [Patella vulgata]|uniref:alpha-1,2-mannosyltransferase ALG9 n=1 Tax=Patella vulgata TaxID=6465 RepID=UPI00217FECA7|nr:alpha-1,2-mannosyltransferase ALG9 [Patella vulgata]
MAAAMKKRSINKTSRKPSLELQSSKDLKKKHDNSTPFVGITLIIIIRLCSAVWTIIGDCDEVYNYWEPAHYLVHKKGFQTWEYSPVYAIRSYLYVWLYTIPARIVNTILTDNKVVQFYVVRLVLALICSLCEIYFYRGVYKQFGVNTNRMTQWFSLFSAGMFIATPAFLPSSFSMYLTFLSMGAWFHGNFKIAILSTAASTFIGWPFVAVLGIPIAFDILIRQKKFFAFITWCLIAVILFLVPMMMVDSRFYGKLVIAPLNIILYNVFGEHGPELYGVEPVSFYLINGFLNFNLAFLAALVSLPFVLIIQLLSRFTSSKIPIAIVLSPMYIWMVIFFTTPHKEERFLFPIYPFFALAAAICIDHIQRVYCAVFGVKGSGLRYYEFTSWIPLTVGCLFTLLSSFRVLALYKGYHASMDVYMELNRISKDPQIHPIPDSKTVNVCVGKEWYRYPSSFFLPGEKWHLRFLKSDFAGQLPKPYNTSSDGTKTIPTDMNDRNLEEKSRYFDVKRCHYLIDLDLTTSSKTEPHYSGSHQWNTIYSLPFLDASRSHRFFRAFYVPFLSRKFCTYGEYNLLQSKKLSKS